MSILDIIPRPTAISLGPDGQTFLASELRLGDWADLEAFIRDRHPSPYEVAAPFLESLDENGRPFKDLLSDTIDKQEGFPPYLGSPESNKVLASPEGTVFFLWVALRRHQPAFTIADAANLFPTVTREDYRRLERIVWSVDGMAKLMEFIEGPPEEHRQGVEPDWPALWHRYTTTVVCGPAFEDLTLNQFNAFMGDGKLRRVGFQNVPAAEFDWERLKRIRKFFEQPKAGYQ